MSKISKKVGVVFLILSLFSLIGCGSLDQRQAKQIEKKLSEMYEGKTFEVLALGNRWGTLTNDTVTAHVKDVERDIVFVIKMNTKGEIVANNYIGRWLNSQLESLLIKNFKGEGMIADSLIIGFVKKRPPGTDPDMPLGLAFSTKLDPDISLSEFISEYEPEYFSGDLVIKESENNMGEAFIKAFRKTFEEIQQTHLQTHVWVIHKECYDELIEEFSRLPDVDNSWFDDKNVLSYFQFCIDENGVTNLKEEEVDGLLRGGE
ncbi:hypothetical protein [Fervidibacillus halotolerans]|uniref:Uncharacterized protein n=1 Tax=Fervidibacillus halotolerans TaxID=2980027 RepID=A0A9E8RY50_9BACI|nr:hypothetical protein [Fervidibacillus halotolerans]WAA12481.1 hypothetical protein OE105_13305 [Fervidibacillus halotolerans]